MGSKIPAILVHGGAGKWPDERQKAAMLGVIDAVENGFDVLVNNGTPVDAVEQAVILMEDNEVFNAGVGSSLALNKQIEMESSIMDGQTLSAGAVGLLNNVSNPVSLARIVMEKTDHVFIVGQSAEKLAEAFRIKQRCATTTLRERRWLQQKKEMSTKGIASLPKLSELVKSHPSLFRFDTVGAIAVDKHGNVAAATSTGGISLKIPGRIGDSPLIGCGNYADNEAGACSATGVGEVAIKLVLAKGTCNLIRSGQTPQAAVEQSIREVNRRIQNATNSMGLIAIDTKGRFGAAHNSHHLCWGYKTPNLNTAKVFMKARIVGKAI